jgi:hypothetical protein
MTTGDALAISALIFPMVLLLRDVWPRAAGYEGLVGIAFVTAAAVYRAIVFGDPWTLGACVAGAFIGWPLALWLKRWGRSTGWL